VVNSTQAFHFASSRCFLNAKGVYNYADERYAHREGQDVAPGIVEENR
jgi:hypothetical protein